MTCVSNRNHIWSRDDIKLAASQVGVHPWMIKIHNDEPVLRPSDEIPDAKVRWLESEASLKGARKEA